MVNVFIISVNKQTIFFLSFYKIIFSHLYLGGLLSILKQNFRGFQVLSGEGCGSAFLNPEEELVTLNCSQGILFLLGVSTGIKIITLLVYKIPISMSNRCFLRWAFNFLRNTVNKLRSGVGSPVLTTNPLIPSKSI